MVIYNINAAAAIPVRRSTALFSATLAEATRPVVLISGRDVSGSDVAGTDVTALVVCAGGGLVDELVVDVGGVVS